MFTSIAFYNIISPKKLVSYKLTSMTSNTHAYLILNSINEACELVAGLYALQHRVVQVVVAKQTHANRTATHHGQDHQSYLETSTQS